MSRLLAICLLVFGMQNFGFGALINSNFESDPNGSNSPTGWTISGGGSGGSQVTNATAAVGNQSLFLTSTVTSDSTRAIATFPTQGAVALQLNGFARAEQTNLSITPLGLIDLSNNRANVLSFGSDGNFWFQDGSTSTDTGVSYQAGEWYRLEQSVDLGSHRWAFSIFNSSSSLLASGSNLQFDNGFVSTVNRIRSFAPVSPTGSWHIDDVTLGQVVPEPSAFLLIGMGAIGLVGYRLRRKQNPTT